MSCAGCGFDNPPNMRFCGRCGLALLRPCPSCGKQNPPEFRFCGHCAAALTPSEPQGPSGEGERRQLTVLFCDLVGSAALSERVDPEDLSLIIRQYHERCRAVVERYDGHVAQFLGDGVLVYFGYPRAEEDAARTAVHAAFELRSAIQTLGRRLPVRGLDGLEVRIGVHTGLVVVGGTDDAESGRLALGETPNIAARLQALAEPDTVVLSEVTQRLVARAFLTEPLGEHSLKGFSRPVVLHRVTGRRDAEGMRLGEVEQDEVPLVGRVQESELLVDRLEQSLRGQGQIVLLSGEAGIGKSRLTALLRQQMRGRPHVLLECWGSKHFSNSALVPVINLLRRTLGLGQAEREASRQRLEELLSAYGLPVAETAPLLEELLSLEAQPPGTASPQRRQQTLQAAVDLIVAMAAHDPVILIAEDLHWMDPSTLELLGLLVARGPVPNLFALFTYRPEFVPPWSAQAHVGKLVLNRLTRKQAGSIVRWLACGKQLPVEVFRQIVDKTDGVPIFVEELTRMVLESGLLQEREQHFELAAPLDSLSIPSTLQDSLMARLDRLGADKELVQLGATIGREVLFTLLQAVTPQDERGLRERLGRLVNKELFYQQGLPPQLSYTFSHALVQEAAYQSLLRSTRQRYHAQIAEALQAQFPEAVQENPELLAHHLTEAGRAPEAIGYWLKAGQRAMQRSANTEAAANLAKGLELVRALPESPERYGAELALESSYGLATIMIKGYAAPEVERAFERARVICEAIGQNAATLPVLCGLWEFYVVRAEFERALGIAERLRPLLAAGGDATFAPEIERIVGTTLLWRGDLAESVAYLEQGAGAAGHAEATRTRPPRDFQDTGVASLALLGCGYWLTGRADQALDSGQRGLALARHLEHPFSQAYAAGFLSIVHELRGDRLAVLTEARGLIALCAEYGFPFWLAAGRMLEAWARRDLDLPSRIRDYEQGLAGYQATGSRLALSYLKGLLAALYAEAGDLERAEAVLAQAIAEALEREELFFLPDLYRRRGLLHAARGDLEAAEAAWAEALALAERTGGLALALRVRSTLAEQRLAGGRADEAEALLAPALAAVTEGARTADLTTAYSLLERARRGETSKTSN
jgi:class 3 adenylate cyclase/predicted ATPase